VGGGASASELGLGTGVQGAVAAVESEQVPGEEEVVRLVDDAPFQPQEGTIQDAASEVDALQLPPPLCKPSFFEVCISRWCTSRCLPGRAISVRLGRKSLNLCFTLK
jgi:hypothetical protein